MSENKCCACKKILDGTYIKCAECKDLNICTGCFATGCEIKQHKNNHSYRVANDDITDILENQWSARDEKRLLFLLNECGYGNWDDIGRRLGKPPMECKMHYDRCYIKNPPDELKKCLPPPRYLPTSLPPYKLKLYCENPPRLMPTFFGYNALRSEFDIDYDRNIAENDLSFINDEDDDDDEEEDCDEGDDDKKLMEELRVTLVKIYNTRLKAREQRRRIIREHGLISYNKNYAAYSPYITTLGRTVVENFFHLAKLMNGPQFDYLLEGLTMSHQLYTRIKKLIELRSYGVKTLGDAKLMFKLAEMRNRQNRELKSSNIPFLKGINKIDVVKVKRRTAPPLEISPYPKYELLTPDEREMCANVRIIPENYLDFKNQLVNECQKDPKGIRLAQARKIIKIDVNKTRKLFDFLMEQRIIYPPSNVD